MEISTRLARHIREFNTGGNMTWSNVSEVLADVTWEEATYELEGFNTIAKLVYHIRYYMEGVSEVFTGGELSIRDKYSFDCPVFEDAASWENFKEQVLSIGGIFADRVAAYPNASWEDNFTDERYGVYFRNIIGLLEHSYYHLGQIVIIKKMLRSPYLKRE